MPAPKQRTRTTYRTGLMAEALCRWALRLKGYRVVASRYRSGLGEIDIVAVRGRTLALVEVKARGSRRAASEAVTPRQQDRLTRAAAAFLARNPRYNRYDVRFDVMLVTPWRWPAHIAAAWTPAP